MTHLIKNYLDKNDWRIKENANVGYSLQGLGSYLVSNVTKDYWLNDVYSPPIKNAHEQGDLHIHDLGLLAAYCCGWDLKDLLIRGFRGGDYRVASKPPKHFRAAVNQLVNFFTTVQAESAGAQAVSSFDTYLAPLVRNDNLSYQEVKQSLQEFIFSLNMPSRAGFQTPFINVTMDLICPKMIAEEPIIIAGEPQEGTRYGDYQKEIDMINTAFCEVMTEGDANGRVFTFPIPTYNVDKSFPWDSPVVNRIMTMTAKYGIPYFSNFINSDLSPEDARSMCCRLRLDNRELRKRGGGLFGANPLTGSIGVVTINLARLGYTSHTEEDLYKQLDQLMTLARESLMVKREFIEELTEQNLFPYSRYYLSDVYDRFGQSWANHFNTIGINGMNECIQNFSPLNEDGAEHMGTPAGQKFAVRIMEYMRDQMRKYQEETGQLFNLEATPAEGTGYRFALLDKKQFPHIIQSGEDEPYYTNSTHLPVGYTSDLFEALDLQDEVQSLYTGGTVLHGFLGESMSDPAVVGKLIKSVFTKYKLPYFTITPTFSVCKNHGYLSGEHFECPTCGSVTEVWSRVVGFYRPIQQWNNGKQEEYKDRKEYDKANTNPIT